MRTVTGGEAFFRVTLSDDTWDFDPSDLTVAQWKAIVAETGQSPDEWLQDVQRGMPDAVQALIWWLQGRRTKPDAVDFRFGDLDIQIIEKQVEQTPKAKSGKKLTPMPTAS